MPTRFETALAIQDAGNLRAIAREFVKVVDEASEATQATVATWHDPAVILFALKIASLTGVNLPGVADGAYTTCELRKRAAAREDAGIAADNRAFIAGTGVEA